MIYVIAGLVILCVIEGVLLIQYSSMLHTVRARLLRQIRANMILQSIADSRVREEIRRRKHSRTMPVDMTEVE